MTARPDLLPVVDRILAVRRTVPAQRSVLVAISGIDGAGKGHVAALLDTALRAHGQRTALLHADGWLELPSRRFAATLPAEHFYRHAFRFADLFGQLVLPLRDRRAVDVVTEHADETATAFRPRRHVFDDVDVVVLEGIFLCKRELRSHYDLSVWVECGFDTALARAIARAQEGLPPAETVRAYRTIYFPAQEIHFGRDDPKAAATLIVDNDQRAGPPISS